VRPDLKYARDIVYSLSAARDNVHRAALVAKEAGLSHSDIGRLEHKLMDVTEAWALILESYLGED